MGIYEDSKTFIVNTDIEKVVADVTDIMKNKNPYGQIFRLPELLENFISLYNSLLQEKQEPVDNAIQDARSRVFNELEGKLCHDKLKDKFVKLFQEISNKAETCNNVATLENIKIEADTLKIRCLNEIASEEFILIPVERVDNKDHNGVPPTPVISAKKQRKTISIKTVNNVSTWQIETEEDVKRYIAELEKKLINSLEDNTIINVEF